jgi:hypothetical protein
VPATGGCLCLQARDKQLALQLDYAADCLQLLYGDALRMRQI